MLTYNTTQISLFLLAAITGLGGGIIVFIQMCKRNHLSPIRLIFGLEKGVYITLYTLREKILLLFIACVSLGIVVIAIKIFKTGE